MTLNKQLWSSEKEQRDIADEILPHARKRQHKKRAVLFTHGQIINNIMIIIDGWIKLSTETIDGKESVVDILTAGDILGERAVLGIETQAFSAEVISKNATVLEIPVGTIKESIEYNPKVGFYFLSSLVLHLQSLRTHIEHLTYATAVQRVSCFLLSFNTDEGERFSLPCSKTQIATYLCMERETLSRTLANLKREGCILLNEGCVTILDEEKLMAHNPMHEEEPLFARSNALIESVNQLMLSRQDAPQELEAC